MTLRLLQHVGVDGTRSVIAATKEGAAFVTGVDSVRALAERAIAAGTDLAGAVSACGTGDSVDIAAELAAGRLTSPIDHVDPAHLIMTGTGLTHLGSAEGRDKMHRAAADAEKQTDSMRMFLEGVEGGKPAAGTRGQQPEWFYKGDGSGLH
jgi:hypothetical protein